MRFLIFAGLCISNAAFAYSAKANAGQKDKLTAYCTYLGGSGRLEFFQTSPVKVTDGYNEAGKLRIFSLVGHSANTEVLGFLKNSTSKEILEAQSWSAGYEERFTILWLGGKKPIMGMPTGYQHSLDCYHPDGTPTIPEPIIPKPEAPEDGRDPGDGNVAPVLTKKSAPQCGNIADEVPTDYICQTELTFVKSGSSKVVTFPWKSDDAAITLQNVSKSGRTFYVSIRGTERDKKVLFFKNAFFVTNTKKVYFVRYGDSRFVRLLDDDKAIIVTKSGYLELNLLTGVIESYDYGYAINEKAYLYWMSASDDGTRIGISVLSKSKSSKSDERFYAFDRIQGRLIVSKKIVFPDRLMNSSIFSPAGRYFVAPLYEEGGKLKRLVWNDVGGALEETQGLQSGRLTRVTDAGEMVSEPRQDFFETIDLHTGNVLKRFSHYYRERDEGFPATNPKKAPLGRFLLTMWPKPTLVDMVKPGNDRAISCPVPDCRILVADISKDGSKIFAYDQRYLYRTKDFRPVYEHTYRVLDFDLKPVANIQFTDADFPPPESNMNSVEHHDSVDGNEIYIEFSSIASYINHVTGEKFYSQQPDYRRCLTKRLLIPNHKEVVCLEKEGIRVFDLIPSVGPSPKL